MFNNSTNSFRNQIIRRSDGKIVGRIEKRKLTKNVYASRHLLRSPRGWAWDVDILKEAEQLGVIETTIHEQENNLDYSAKLNDFWNHGVKLNRGFGDQICLPIKYWQVVKTGRPECKQLSLMGF